MWPSAFKTTMTVIAWWTSMPTSLTLLIGRLLAVGILVTAYSRLLLAGRPFILRVLTSDPNHRNTETQRRLDNLCVISVSRCLRWFALPKSNQVRSVQSLRSDTDEIRGFANAVYQSLLF